MSIWNNSDNKNWVWTENADCRVPSHVRLTNANPSSVKNWSMLDSNVHAQKIIGRQSFANHVIKSRPMKRQQNLLYFDHNGIVQLGTELKMPFHLVYLVETLNGYTFFSFLYLTDGKRNKQEPITRRAELPHMLLRDPRCFLRRSPGEHWGRGETNCKLRYFLTTETDFFWVE